MRSVLGDQQDFLCAKEAVMRRSGAALAALPRAPRPAPPPAGMDEVRRPPPCAALPLQLHHQNHYCCCHLI